MEQKLSRREMIRGIAGLVLASPILAGLEAQVIETKTKQKTPEDYRIKIDEYYGTGLFLCTEILDEPKLEGLECFRGINRGLKSPKGEWHRNEPIYRKDEKFYLVVYNPDGKNHKLILDLSRVIEEEGIKFIDEKPYKVKIRKGKIVEKKLDTDEPPKEGDIFYEMFQRKLDILHPTEFEEVAKKGPFELKGNHRAFSVEKLSPGLYNARYREYLGENSRVSHGVVHSYFTIAE